MRLNKTSAILSGILLAVAASPAQQYLITTVAGGGLPPTGMTAANASFNRPQGVAVDAAGNVYFGGSNAIFKIDGAGILTRVAGFSALQGYSGDGGPALKAQLYIPEGMAFDSTGNLFIADYNNAVIRRIAPDGTITTVAGSGTRGYAGDGGPAIGAQLNHPTSVAFDGAGNLYISDTINSVIRRVAPNGTITTVAGTGTAGYSGDNGPAISAKLNSPQGVWADAAGNIFIPDSNNNVVRKVAPNGIITTVAGTGTSGYSGDGGPATAAKLAGPYTVITDSAGDLFIGESVGRIRKVTPDGNISTLTSQFNLVFQLAIDAAGNLYVADTIKNQIGKVQPNGTVTIIAGTGSPGSSGDGGSAGSAQVNPQAVARDSSGNLFIADTTSNRVRKVATNGIITTVAGTGVAGYQGDGGAATSAQLNGPAGVAVDGLGNIFIADTGNSVVRKVTAGGIISTLSVTGLLHPRGLSCDSANNLFIADTQNQVIRLMTSSGGSGIVAGMLNAGGYSGDGGNATSARLSSPYGVTVAPNNTFYIAEQGNHVVRKVSASGTITTVAGNGTAGYAGDGGPATSAQLYWPEGVAIDAAGNLYIADAVYSYTIRKVDTVGNISTIAGGGPGYWGDGGIATNAKMYPWGVVVDPAGNLYVPQDFGAVRLLVPQGTHAMLSVSAAASPASFAAGQTGVTYSVIVSNLTGTGPTAGAVSVTSVLSSGLTLVSMSGTGWNCAGNICMRTDPPLAAGVGYPAITVTANVGANPPAQVSNMVNVTGGGSLPASSLAITNITQAPEAPVLVSPANATPVGIVLAPVLSWNAADGATSYDVHFGTSAAPPLVANTTGTTYAVGNLNPGSTYYWQIVAKNAGGTAASATWSFNTLTQAPVGVRFVPVTPCRIADTRKPAGTFGGPSMAGGTSRSFPVPQSACSIPATAQAYSLNVTVIPPGALSYLTLWPTGQTQPFASTLNSFAGDVVANAAIVPAGTNGGVSVFVTNTTDVILDINGYFDSSTGPASLAFYTAPPCRVVDTRSPAGQFGGPTMPTGTSRDFPIPLSSCTIPATARAYSLNATVVPAGYLGYLSTWPTGQPQPVVSTLNAWDGQIIANAAIVPAGSNESVSVFVSNQTDVILDVNGYFAQPGSPNALLFYPVTPCRVTDTRNPAGPFGGPIISGGQSRSFTVPASVCNIPATAAAYSLNITVVPAGSLPYLTAWPAGATQPWVSTLNSLDGLVLANAAIVPAGVNGAISIFVANSSHVIVDIDGYFAP